MRTIFLGLCLLLVSSVFAQRNCASATYLETEKNADPVFAKRISEIEAFIQSRNSLLNKEAGDGSSALIRIPVVVHVLYNSTDQNISDQQVMSQIDALNRDFRMLNADTINIPSQFRLLATDVQVEFQLAISDPEGRPTSGIVRKYTSLSSWSADDRIKFSSQGGDDAWDSRYYLNIWVGNLKNTVGYSTAPGAAAEKDGIVIHTAAFGTINRNSPYNMGRTAVHEAGHWLGLKHIWGDVYCGDDMIDDTPKQGNFTAGCPTGFRSSCNNGTTGDMYMNYMDYTDDACLNMFTKGQKARMQAYFLSGGPRNSILNSKAFLDPWMPALETPEVVPSMTMLFPNPSISSFTIQTESCWIGKTFRILNAQGALVKIIGIHSQKQSIDISSLQRGVYFVQGESGSHSFREKLVKL